MEEFTREAFLHFPLWMKIFFYILAFISILIFFIGVYLKFSKYKKGRSIHLQRSLLRRLWETLRSITLFKSLIMKGKPYEGVSHDFTLWGFMFLLLGTAILTVQEDITRFFGLKFIKGDFYIFYSFILDIAGVVCITGIILMAIRRFILKRPSYPDLSPSTRNKWISEDWIFLSLLFWILLSGLFVESIRIAATRSTFEKMSSPVGYALAVPFFNVDKNALFTPYKILWWLHALPSLAFVSLLPFFTKFFHPFSAFFSLLLKDERAGKVLPKMIEDRDYQGYQYLSDFTRKELIGLDACIRCGRCDEVCAAKLAGDPLVPRSFINDMKLFTDEAAKEKNLNLDGKIEDEIIWSCVTCMACMSVCPVAVDHVPLMVQLRRLSIEKGRIDKNLQDVLVSFGRYGNSFTQSERKRGSWALDLKIKDVRKEEAEFLWFVGDYLSYHPSLSVVLMQTADVFNKLGLDFGILYEGERNSGNDIRRIGEEGLFEECLEKNLKVLERGRFKKILTTDPHTFHTLRNEYPEYGASYEVLHYTQLLDKVLNGKKMKRLGYKVTYFDPCHLGRYNGIYEEPRRILKRLGMETVERAKTRDMNLCCGAGGGRLFMTDVSRGERPSVKIVKEAASLDVQYLVVACPKDYVMFTDAIKTVGLEDKLLVKDIAELVYEAI